MATKKITYKEPASYFPKDILKECELGQYNKDAQKPAKKPAKKK